MLLPRYGFALVPLVLVLVASTVSAQVVNSEWNIGNGNWNVATNWFPIDVPDNGGGFTYNVQIGNRPVAVGAQVDFVPVSGTSDTITSLTVSNNADLTTNGNQLNVLAATIIDGVGTTIRVDPHATPGTAALTSLDLNLNNGGGLTMAGGIVEVTSRTRDQRRLGPGRPRHGQRRRRRRRRRTGVRELRVCSRSKATPRRRRRSRSTPTASTRSISTASPNTGVVDVDNALANVNADTVTLDHRRAAHRRVRRSGRRRDSNWPARHADVQRQLHDCRSGGDHDERRQRRSRRSMVPATSPRSPEPRSRSRAPR